jgi:hypothetical protein
MRLAPKFVGNEQDGAHCALSCVLMVSNSIGNSLTMADVEKLTNYDPRYHTWLIQAANALAQSVSGVQIQTVFDYEQFAKQGEQYLVRQWPEKKLIAQRQVASPGFAKEIAAAIEFISIGSTKLILSNQIDRSTFEQQLRGNLAIALVNHSALHKRSGTSILHAVVVYGASDAGNFYFLHDPGPPFEPALRVEADTFWRALDPEIIIIPHSDIPFGKTFNSNEPCYCGSGNKFKYCHKPVYTSNGSLR